MAELLQVDYEMHKMTRDPLNLALRRYAGMTLTNLTFGDVANKVLRGRRGRGGAHLTPAWMWPWEVGSHFWHTEGQRLARVSLGLTRTPARTTVCRLETSGLAKSSGLFLSGHHFRLHTHEEGRERTEASLAATAGTATVPCQSQQATLCARRGCMEAIVAQLASESEELHQVPGAGWEWVTPGSKWVGRGGAFGSWTLGPL